MKTYLSYLLTAVITSAIWLNACQRDMGVTNIKIKIDTTAPARSTREDEEILVSNCEGSTELVETLGSVKTIEKTVHVDKIASNRNGSDFEIPESLHLQLEIEVEDAYQQIYETTILRLESKLMHTAPGKQSKFVIRWENVIYQSTASFTHNENVYKVTYSYKLVVPKVIYEEEIDCPSSTVQLTHSIAPAFPTTESEPTPVVTILTVTPGPINPTPTQRAHTPRPTMPPVYP